MFKIRITDLQTSEVVYDKAVFCQNMQFFDYHLHNIVGSLRRAAGQNKELELQFTMYHPEIPVQLQLPYVY